MAVRARIRVPAGGDASQAVTMTAGLNGAPHADEIPVKEFSISDDILNLSDCASVSISNESGNYSDRFAPGQRIEFDIADDRVAGGKWVRSFTGRITTIEDYTDIGGGSNILLTAYDLGWHLTSSHAPPIKADGKTWNNIKNITFDKLLAILIDPSWGFGATKSSNDLNRRLKHGRQIIIQNHKPVLGAILPFIQVEPGQTPLDLLQLYAAREGVLLNVSARGELTMFRPDYNQQALYTVEYHGDAQSTRNNVVKRPTLRQTIDGLYSEVQCWSTVTIPPEIQNSENPNEAYRHTTYTPTTNPVAFKRVNIFSDGEAINQKLRTNRAIWKYQMGQFNSWTYECDFPSLSQGGAFFVSDTMITVNDTWRKLSGTYYVQSTRRSLTLSDGQQTHVVIRKPGLLNPALNSLDLGGGAARVQTKAAKK